MIPSINLRRARRGSLLTDVSLGLGILGIMVVLYLNANNTEQRRLMAVQAGAHLRSVAELAQAYILVNFTALETAAAGGPVTVSMPALLASGGFSGLTANSPIDGHQLCVVVTRPAARRLDGMVISTGGTALSQKDLSEVRKAGGFFAGEIDGGVIRGTRSAWSVSASSFTAAGCVPTDGHFAYALNVAGTQVAGTALSRVRIPGLPEANQAAEHITLQRTCDDPTTPGVETGADCTIRADGQAANEPGLDRRRIQMINSLISGVYADNGGNLNVAATLSASALRANLIATSGDTCSLGAGAIARDGAGNLLLCIGGSWRGASGSSDLNLLRGVGWSTSCAAACSASSELCVGVFSASGNSSSLDCSTTGSVRNCFCSGEAEVPPSWTDTYRTAWSVSYSVSSGTRGNVLWPPYESDYGLTCSLDNDSGQPMLSSSMTRSALLDVGGSDGNPVSYSEDANSSSTIPTLAGRLVIRPRFRMTRVSGSGDITGQITCNLQRRNSAGTWVQVHSVTQPYVTTSVQTFDASNMVASGRVCSTASGMTSC